MLDKETGFKFAYMNGQTLQKYMAPLAGGLQAVYTAPTPAEPAYWRHSDWLGSSRLATTPARTAYYDGAYAPFGESYSESGTHDRSFTGQNQDETGPYYDFLLRQHSSSQGRWMVPDPAGLAAVDLTNPQTWNRYAYVGNNPLNATDPLGLYCAVGNPDTGATLGGCNPEGDAYFGSGWSGNLPGPGGWGLGGSGFSSTSTFSLPCGGDIDFPCSLPVSSPIQSILDLFNVPTNLNCPTGLSFLCGGIDPAMEESPSNPTPWYKTCSADAIGSGLLHIGIDAIGLFPEAEGFTKVFENTAGYQIARAVGNSAGYRGVVATQYGMKAVAQAKGGVNAISGAFGLGDTSVEGRISTGLTVAGFMPVLSTGAAVSSIGLDSYKTWKAIGQCP